MQPLLNLHHLEHELKKRLNFPYQWGAKQNNADDAQTNFIYQCRSFNALQNHSLALNNPLKNYAYNRWLNFWSAKAVEQIFTQHPRVQAHPNPLSKTIDFYIDNLAFDHKTSVFPKQVHLPITHYLHHKQELIYWLYQHQSKQGRQHFENRIFLVLYNQANLQHWQLKTEISLLQENIVSYLNNFNKAHLPIIQLANKDIFSDIIWIIKT